MEANKDKKKISFKEFFQLGEVGSYFFRKKSAERPTNINIRLMHGINRLAILIFLISLILWFVKRFLM